LRGGRPTLAFLKKGRRKEALDGIHEKGKKAKTAVQRGAGFSSPEEKKKLEQSLKRELEKKEEKEKNVDASRGEKRVSCKKENGEGASE